MSGVRPSRRGKMRALLSSETSDRSESGDDVDFDGGGVFTDTSALDSWKQPVRVASTAAVTISTALNSGDTLDGVTLATDDRVLLKDQAAPAENGIYVVGATPERAADMDDDDEVLGALVYVIAGTTNTATAWKVTNTAAVTVGSTSIVFAAFGTGGSSSFATPAIVLGSSAAAGAASTVIRSDSTIAAFDATSPTTQAFGDSAVVGTAAFAARRDHKHAMPTAAVTTSGHTMTTARLLGRTTASTGAIEEITVGTGLSLSAGSLTATGGGGGGLAGSFAGYNTIGASWETFSANRQYCKTITLASAADVQSVDAYLRPSTDNVEGIYATILADNAGSPGVLVAASGIAENQGYLSNSSTMPGAGRWLSLPMGAYLAAGTYWICVITRNGRLDIAYDVGTDKYFTATLFLATGAYPSAWTINTSARQYSIRARILS